MITPSGAKHFLIPGTPEKTREMAGTLLELYRGLELSDKQTSALKLALDEAVTNAVTHGHGGDRSKEITVRCEWTPDSVALTVSDQGKGFNCKKLPNPTKRSNLMKECGRGLYIISAIMSSVSFNEKGNEIRMTLDRKAEC